MYIIKINAFNKSISTHTHLNYLLKNKIKLFSHKEKETRMISESLFDSEFSLKKIFNNQEESMKTIIWKDLQELLLTYNEYLQFLDPTDINATNRIKMLDLVRTKETNPILNEKLNINKILNTNNLNDTTNDMMNDIFDSFNSFIETPDKNLFDNIMQISQKISNKYQDKISNGEIKVADILTNITNVPGMEKMGDIVSMLTTQLEGVTPQPVEKIIIDENFTTDLVVKGQIKDNNFNIRPILNCINSFTANDKSINTDSLMNLFGKISNTNDPDMLSNIFQNELGIDINKFTEEITNKLK